MDPNFLTNIYVIKWTNPGGGNQHGGYFLDYEGRTYDYSHFERDGGPIWFWYLSLIHI